MHFNIEQIVFIPLFKEAMKEIRVASVEDIDQIREGLKYVIEYTEGFHCIGAFENGELALESLPESPAEVVLMDINLPGIQGTDCVKQLKEQLPGTQFMMFTVFEDDENVFEAIKSGASGYILKSTPPHKVLEAIREIHQGGSPITASIARKVIQHFQKPKTSENFSLTPRETEILHLLAKGLFYKEIADTFGTSTGTVRQQIHKIYEKLHVQNRTEALLKFKGDS
jgi:DNA-binding NarL/FixJ family response regulator